MLYDQWHKRRYLQVWTYQDNVQVVHAPLAKPRPQAHSLATLENVRVAWDEVTFGLE